jgi:hypothetical protein
MTLLLVARHLFLAGLVVLVASYVWLMVTDRD